MSNLRLNSNLYKNDLIQKHAEKPPAQADSKDTFVDATSGTVNIKDLDGAVDQALNHDPSLAGIPVKNSIFIGIKNNGKVEVHRIDLKDPQNLKAIKAWQAGLKAGQTNLPFPFSRLKPETKTIDSDLGPPRLNALNLSKMSDADPDKIVDQVKNLWHSFGLNQMQEGQQLSNEQKLYLAANVLQNNGLLEGDQKQAKYILKNLFFDNSSTATDVIQNISFSNQQGLKVEFASPFDGDVTRRKDLDIAPPNWYAGSDDNARRAGITALKNKEAGNAVVSGKTVPGAIPSAYSSMVGPGVESKFLEIPSSWRYKAMSPAERTQNPAYQRELNNYKMIHQQNYVKMATTSLLSDLEDFAQKNKIDLKKATPDQLQTLTRQAVRTLLASVENPRTQVTFLTSPRTSSQFSIEDETAVEAALLQLTGATVNLDATPTVLDGFLQGSSNATIQPAR